MSVFTLDAAQGNPVTTETVNELCSELGVTLKDEEREEYRRLLAVFHDASEQLMEMEGEYTSRPRSIRKLTSNLSRLYSFNRRSTLSP